MKQAEYTADINEWKKLQIERVMELNKQDHFYTSFGKKVGQLGGLSIIGYLGKSKSWDESFTYYVAKELKHLFQSWQWHCCFSSDINKRLKRNEQDCKIHEFKTIQEATSFLFTKIC